MTHANNPESGLDVETIIRQIQDDVSASELPMDPAIAESATLDSDLNAILSDANGNCTIGQSRLGAYPCL